MKKHPVDDLFQRKLRDLEKIPSDSAWGRIEVKAAHRKMGAWVWYAAASVTIGLLAGYVVLSGQRNPVVQPELAKIEKAQPVIPDRHANEEVASQHREVALPASFHENSLAQNDRDSKPGKVVKMNPVKVEEIESADNKVIEDVSQNVQVVEINEVREPKSVEQTFKLPAPVHAQALNSPAEPTRTIVVAVETEVTEPEETGKLQKPSKFARVFRQLRNAQAGERIDWEEVGFRPKDLFAKADDRSRDNEGQSAEKHNPKE